jgi:hypothetical protein
MEDALARSTIAASQNTISQTRSQGVLLHCTIYVAAHNKPRADARGRDAAIIRKSRGKVSASRTISDETTLQRVIT